MRVLGRPVNLWFVFIFICIDCLNAEWRSSPKRVTAELGSDLSLSCTFYSDNSDDNIIQWLYQNVTEKLQREHKSHWRPLFLNTQALTSRETRYSIQQKIQPSNQSSLAYSTILTLAKINDSDEGLYMCKSLSPTIMQMTYQVRVIQSLDIHPKQLLIPAEEIGQYSIRLNCILTDHQTGGRHHEIFWWHNNKRLGSQTNRFARIVRNVTQHSFISTLFYTAEPANVVGHFTCESEPLRRSISVKFQKNHSRESSMPSYLVVFIGWTLAWILIY